MHLFTITTTYKTYAISFFEEKTGEVEIALIFEYA